MKPPHLELRHIRVVLALARHRHFGKAARELGLTQSALSKSLRSLEDELGATLFERSPAGVATTPDGDVFVRRGAALLADAEGILHEIAGGGSRIGRLRFGVGPFLAAEPVGLALGRFVHAHPAVEVEATVDVDEVLLRMLERSEIDLYVGSRPDSGGQVPLESRSLRPRKVVAYCRRRHPLVDRRGVRPEELLRYRLVSHPAPVDLRKAASGAHSITARHEGPATGLLEITNVAMINAILAESDSIAIVPASRLAPFPEADVIELNVDMGEMVRDVAVVSRADRPAAPAASRFIDYVLAVDDEIASQSPRRVIGAETRVPSHEASTGDGWIR